jgi:hypothetical protein
MRTRPSPLLPSTSPHLGSSIPTPSWIRCKCRPRQPPYYQPKGQSSNCRRKRRRRTAHQLELSEKPTRLPTVARHSRSVGYSRRRRRRSGGAAVTDPGCAKTGALNLLVEVLLNLVNLKTKSAGDGYPKKPIEKTVLRFLGSRTFSHGLDPFRPNSRVAPQLDFTDVRSGTSWSRRSKADCYPFKTGVLNRSAADPAGRWPLTPNSTSGIPEAHCFNHLTHEFCLTR